jgi:hypothetical protein
MGEPPDGNLVKVKGELWLVRGFLAGEGPPIVIDGEVVGVFAIEATMPGGKCGSGDIFLGCCCILLAVSSIFLDCSSNLLTVLFVLCFGGVSFGETTGVTDKLGLLFVIFWREWAGGAGGVLPIGVIPGIDDMGDVAETPDIAIEDIGDAAETPAIPGIAAE